MMMTMMMMIDVLRPRLCTWQAKWAERPPKVMRRSRRWNTLQIHPRRDSNSGGSELWSSALPAGPRRRPSSGQSAVSLPIWLPAYRLSSIFSPNRSEPFWPNKRRICWRYSPSHRPPSRLPETKDNVHDINKDLRHRSNGLIRKQTKKTIASAFIPLFVVYPISYFSLHRKIWLDCERSHW